jgi:uncharacterized repeat protein (TIGR01451 family)
MNASVCPDERKWPIGRTLRLLLVAGILAVLTTAAALPVVAHLSGQDEAVAASPVPPAVGMVGTDWSQLPLRFIANRGQSGPEVRFTVQGAGHTLFFTSQEVVFSAVRGENEDQIESVVRLSFPGANATPSLEGRHPLPGGANYFIGNDPARWQVNVPTYAELAYRDLYPGVDLVYSGHAGQLKSDFHLAPAVDPGVIRLAYRGIQGARILPDGALSLQTALGELVEAPPLVFQETGGRRLDVDGRYVILAERTSNSAPTAEVEVVVSFEIGAHDPTLPLVIDPTLSYSSFLGGSSDEVTGLNSYNHAIGIALDPAGNMYIAGQTASSNFPTDPQAIQSAIKGSSDAFVTQLISATGGYTYGFSTYLGGAAADYANGIVVDSAGAATVVGATASTNFPVFAAAQTTSGGAYDAFVTRIISQSGVYTFEYSTYLGGSSLDIGHGVALDGSGNAWVVGETYSLNFFTTTTAIQPAAGGVGGDAFVTQIANTGGYTFAYSSFMGGAGVDRGLAIALDTSDNVFVTGETGSSDFPVFDPLRPVLLGYASSADVDASATYRDAFAAKIITSGPYTYAYSTYLGGTFPDVGRGIVVDSDGYAWVTGNTASQDMVVSPDAIQPTYGGGTATGGGGDAFVTRIVEAGGVYTYGYSSFLGGASNETGHGITIDTAGNIVVVGETNSNNFPTHYPAQAGRAGIYDAFVTQLVSGTTALTYGISTYLGGSGLDSGRALAVDGLGDIYLAGHTQSTNFPTTANALDRTLSGTSDAFVTRLGWGGLMITKTVTPTVVGPGGSLIFTLVYTNDSPTSASSVVIDDYLPPLTYTGVSYVSFGAVITPTGAYSYTWNVADLAPVSGGTIQVLATLTHSLSMTPGRMITNCATITGSGAYPNAAYNLGCVEFVVGQAVYLPVVSKNS